MSEREKGRKVFDERAGDFGDAWGLSNLTRTRNRRATALSARITPHEHRSWPKILFSEQAHVRTMHAVSMQSAFEPPEFS